MKYIVIVIIEFKGIEDMDLMIFSEVLRLGQQSTRCKNKNRPRIFIKHKNNECYQDIIDEVLLLNNSNIVFFCIEGASKTLVDVLQGLKKRSGSITAHFINPTNLINGTIANIDIQHYFTDCGDQQSSDMKSCIEERTRDFQKHNITWVSIQKNPIKELYSITLLRLLYYDLYY
jgi:hypothetical protein